MSNLVQSNRKKNKKIDRGHDIKPENTFTLDDNKNKANSEKKVDRVTFYANLRINNHLRNKLEAISTIGISKSNKESLEIALDYYIDSLPDEQKKKFELIVDTLEQKDVLQQNNK